MQRQFQTKLFI